VEILVQGGVADLHGPGELDQGEVLPVDPQVPGAEQLEACGLERPVVGLDQGGGVAGAAPVRPGDQDHQASPHRPNPRAGA
jgi:hypothetical protein